MGGFQPLHFLCNIAHTMKKLLPFFAFCILNFAFAQAQPRPKLVVGIVVDQMRWDYLYRYYNHYGADGFKRLMGAGFNCQQAMINYLPAFTGPGHSCIYTGSVPAIHGIAGNDWIEDGKSVYCTEDKSVEPVGGSKIWGQMSPKRLLTTTVTDELRLATNMRSRVFAISLKDRSSILPGGHLANGAYWFDDSTGNFMSSNYYDDCIFLMTHGIVQEYHVPEWISTFNSKHFSDTLLSQDWSLRDETSKYKQSYQDCSVLYEGHFSNESTVNFPHLAKHFTGTGAFKYNAIRKIPAGNTLILKLARACIKGETLGRGNIDPDFLAISLSATDYAGHQFGPNALEMEDMYIRLDDEIANFLRYLDRHVGEGEYTVFLTADHGSAHNSLLLNDLNIPAGNVSESALRVDLNAFLKKEWGKDSLVQSLENYQVNFTASKTSALPFEDYLKLKLATLTWLRNRPEVQFAMDMELNGWNTLPEPIQTMAVNGFCRHRSGPIQIILKPGYYAGYAPTGTTHGTWNPYDTHIPLLFYGWGVRKGELYREVHMTDIAATISALLHIQMPNGCVGKVIPEVLK